MVDCIVDANPKCAKSASRLPESVFTQATYKLTYRVTVAEQLAVTISSSIKTFKRSQQILLGPTGDEGNSSAHGRGQQGRFRELAFGLRCYERSDWGNTN